MYPETDVRPITVTDEKLAALRGNLPEFPDERVRRLVREYGIHEQQANQLVKEGFDDLFEEIARSYGLGAVASKTFLNTFPELDREGLDPYVLDEVTMKEVFRSLSEGIFAKEAMPDVLRLVTKGKKVEDAVRELGISAVGSEEAAEIISRIVRERAAFVKEKGMNAVGPLMGMVMEQLKGRIDGKAASELLKKEVKKVLES
jgi:glutamyl-tRNA(Gln) amidotransferase subunit E